MKRFFALLLCLCALLSLAACGKKAPPPPPPEVLKPPEEEAIPAPPPPTPEELQALQIEALLDAMSLEEQVGQLFFPRCPQEHAAEDVAIFHLGGYLLFGRDFKDDEGNPLAQEPFQHKLLSYQGLADIPLLMGVDEEGGTVARVSRNPNLRETKFDSPQTLFQRGGMEAILEEAGEKDALLQDLGINVNLAPVADVSTHPQDFIFDRSFGQGPQETADFVSALVTKMREDQMGSVLKHFPGYGSNVDTHSGIARDSRPLEQFFREDFLPFQAGIAAGGPTTAVLVSHNIMEAVDETLPASLSPAVHRLLREELQFGGVIMTDDLIMEAVAAYAQDGAVAVLALEAGNDLLITQDYQAQIPLVLKALEEGRLEPEKIRCSCRRVLQWKQALGLLPPISPEI